MATKSKYFASRATQLEALKAKGWKVRAFKGAPVVIAWQKQEGGKFFGQGWAGKQDKPSFYYSFRSYERLAEYVNGFVAQQKQAAVAKAKRREEKAAKQAALKASDFFTVGDVIVNSWGYDQTNVDFYQVTAVLAKSVKIRPIAANVGQEAGLTAKNQPRRNDFAGAEILKPVNQWGNITFKHGGARKWDGKAVCSSFTH